MNKSGLKHTGDFVLYAEWDKTASAFIESPNGTVTYYRLYPIGGLAHYITYSADQLRGLRSEITRALGESLQDESRLERASAALAEARSALLDIEAAIRPDVIIERTNA